MMEDQGSAVAQCARASDRWTVAVIEVCRAIDCGKALQQSDRDADGRRSCSGDAAFTAKFISPQEVCAATSDYRLLSLAETPDIKVDVIEGGMPLGGVGEPGVPPVRLGRQRILPPPVGASPAAVTAGLVEPDGRHALVIGAVLLLGACHSGGLRPGTEFRDRARCRHRS
jgi:hypothetical protein